MSAKSRFHLCRYGLPAVALGLVAAGCASPPETLLAFPRNPHLTRTLSQGGTTIVVELDRPVEDFDASVRPQVRADGAGTVYEFPGGHRIMYRFKVFHVGGARYPAGEAVLFAFLATDGPWSFRYRGRTITVERSGRWRPSLYYRSVETETARQEQRLGVGAALLPGRRTPAGLSARRTTKRLEYEELRVLDHQIVFRPDATPWTVNGLEVSSEPGGEIVLADDGTVRLVKG